MSLPNIIHGSEQVSFKVRTAAKGPGRTPIGHKMVIEDGRTYRWTENGAAVTVVGTNYQAIVPVVAETGDQAIATLTASTTTPVTTLTAIGSTTTSFVVDELKDGYVWIDSAANLNPMWKIVSNTAITAGAETGTITIGTPIVDDIASGEQVSFQKNPWKDVIIASSPMGAMEAGLSVVIIAANGFGWLQTGGACKALADGTSSEVLEGDAVCTSVNVDGTLMPAVAQETDGVYVGNVYGDQLDTEFFLVYLSFDNIT